jgi:hypothetical protein
VLCQFWSVINQIHVMKQSDIGKLCVKERKHDDTFGLRTVYADSQDYLKLMSIICNDVVANSTLKLSILPWTPHSSANVTTFPNKKLSSRSPMSLL